MMCVVEEMSEEMLMLEDVMMGEMMSGLVKMIVDSGEVVDERDGAGGTVRLRR